MKQFSPFLLIPVLLAALFWSAEPESPEPLWLVNAPFEPVDEPSDPVVMAHTQVTIPARATRQLAQGKPGQQFLVPLGSGPAVTVTMGAPRRTPTGGSVFTGMVGTGRAAKGQSLWVQEGGRWAGRMQLPDGRRFTLMPRARGGYSLEQVELSRGPGCSSGQLDRPTDQELSALEGSLPAGNGLWNPREPLRRLNPGNRNSDENYERINLRTFPRGHVNNRVTFMNSRTSAEPSSVSLNIKDGAVAGGSTASISSAATDGNAPASPKASINVRKPLSMNSRGGASVDLLVLYCQPVAPVYGGDDGLRAAVQLAVQNANEAFTESGAEVSLRLVHLAAVQYTSAGSIGKDLRNLTFQDKALAAEMNRLRNEHRADLVTLISDRPAGGVGWLLIHAKGMAKMGMNVLGRSSLRGYVLAHEVGHNLGCQHAAGDSGISREGLYPWGYGHRFSLTENNGRNRQVRTVMAYAPGHRIGRFSNPERSYRGIATGTGSANNVKVLNAGVSAVTGYR